MFVNIITVAFVIIAMAAMPTIFHLSPYLADAVFRARGSDALEFNASVARERDMVAYMLFIPCMLLTSRYNLYNPSFMASMGPGMHLLATFGVALAYMILRHVLYEIFKPRRGYDNYRLAHRVIYTTFTIFMIIAMVVVGVLVVFDVNELIIRKVLYAILIIDYSVFLIRKTQLLLLSYDGLRTFLYLCALEVFPITLLIVSAVVL